jgi:hypothetical protein
MIRTAPVLAEGLTCSDTLYIRGFPKSESNDGVLALLAVAATPLNVDLALRDKSGQVWAKYANADDACRSLLVLHNRNVSGAVLSVKYELGVDASGKRRVDPGSHSTVIRSVARRKTGTSTVIPQIAACGVCHAPTDEMNNRLYEKVGVPAKRKSAEPAQSSGVSYTASSLFVGDMEYPFPTGLYLSRVISLCNQRLAENKSAIAVKHDSGCTDPLLLMVTNPKSMGNKYGKEISEAMAMVDAIQRAISLLPPALRTAVLQTRAPVPGNECSSSSQGTVTSPGGAIAPAAPGGPAVRVYVLGDGCQPLSAACLCLHLPEHFTYYSLDPLMREEYCCTATASPDGVTMAVANPAFGTYSNRFFPVALLSQEFILPPTPTASPGGTALGSSPPSAVSVVVSCHSHAPLQEFWDRVSSPKIAVTMACCAGYADLPEDVPVLQFEDFEVYSPKRCVKIYARL